VNFLLSAVKKYNELPVGFKWEEWVHFGQNNRLRKERHLALFGKGLFY